MKVRKRLKTNVVHPSVLLKRHKSKKMDFNSMTEPTLDLILRLMGIRERLDLTPLLEDDIVNIADVGAAGGFHERWEQFGKSLNIYLFEPNEIAYKELEAKYGGDNRVRLFNIALSEYGERLKINVTVSPQSSSVYQHDSDFFSKINMREFYKRANVIEVDSQKLSDIIVNKNLDFIKLDCECYELPILRGGAGLVENCVGIESEVSFIQWARQTPLFGDMDLFCREKGFILSNLSSPVHYHYLLPDISLESQGIVFSGDALWFRTPYEVVKLVKDGRWKPNKIIKAIAIYLSYGNCEYAHVLHEEAVKNSMIRPFSINKIVTKLIRTRSGYGKLLNRRVIRKIKKVLRIPSDSLAY